MNSAPQISGRAALYLGPLMIVALMGTYTVPLVIGSLIEGLRLSAGQAGTLGTVEIFSIAISALLLSGVLHRFRLRLLVSVAILLCASAQALSAFNENYLVMILLRIIAGLGGGMILAVVNSIIATSKSPETLYGWVLAVSSVGFAIILSGLPHALRFNEQQGLFIAIALISFSVIILIRKIPNRRADFRDSTVRHGSAHQAASLPVIACFFFVLTVVYLAMGGVWSFTERVAVNIDIDRDLVGMLLGLSTVAGVAGATSAAVIGRQLGLTLPVLIGFSVSGLSALLIAQSTGIVSYAAGLLLYGYIYMFSISFVLSVGAALDPTGRIAVATNGYILIPYSLGPVSFGLSGIANISALGWICLVSCLLAALLIIPITRRSESSRYLSSI